MAPCRGRPVLRIALDALHALDVLGALRLVKQGLAVTAAMLPAVATLAALAGDGARAAFAAVPPNGTLSDGGAVVYTAGPFFTSNPSAQANGTPICNAALACDQFGLFVALSPAAAAGNNIKISIQWPLTTADFDLYVFDGSNTLVGQSATSNDPETVILPAVHGSYTVLVAPFH